MAITILLGTRRERALVHLWDAASRWGLIRSRRPKRCLGLPYEGAC